MLGPYKIIVDEWSEVWDLLRPHADGSFWQWSQIEFDPNCFYIIGRVQLKAHWQQIRDLALAHPGHVIFCNPAEGSETILLQLKRLRIRDLVDDGCLGLIASGSVEPGIAMLSTDGYFSHIVEYLENVQAHEQAVQVRQQGKPYDFLFLNGRLRPHRKWLIDHLRQEALLERALWTNLQDHVDMAWSSQLVVDRTEPIRYLAPTYEIDRAVPNLNKPPTDHGFVKHQLFGDTWGDAIVNPRCYLDSCFSLVTETIFDYAHTFRTEKIWKPMIMWHPFVVAANRGYYRDLHHAGFRTFGDLIDERFDQIDDPLDRAQAVVATVKDICYNGAWDFLQQSLSACEHNYARLQEHNREQRQRLPQDLMNYIKGLHETIGNLSR